MPDGVVTATLPLVAPGGTVAEICEPEFTENDALRPLKVTVVAPTKPPPLMLTLEPMTPEPVDSDEIDGSTVKVDELAVPAGVVTVISPVVAATGTVAVICDAELTVKLEVVPLKETELAPLNPPPVMVTLAPVVDDVGLSLVILGAGVNEVFDVAVPPEVVTEILPVVALEGTVAMILALELTANFAVEPLNFTDFTDVKPDPLIVTLAPTDAITGENDVILGEAAHEGVARASTVTKARMATLKARFFEVM